MSVPPEKPAATPAPAPKEEEEAAGAEDTEAAETAPAPAPVNKVLVAAVEDMRVRIGMDAKAFKAGFGNLSPEQQYPALKAIADGMKPRLTKNEPIIPTPTGGGQSPYQGKVTGDKVSWSIPLSVVAHNKKVS